MLTKLLAGRITFTLQEAGRARVYGWTAPCSFDQIIRSGVLSERGDGKHAEVWWPQGDSIGCGTWKCSESLSWPHRWATIPARTFQLPGRHSESDRPRLATSGKFCPGGEDGLL
jgi:hypothetical protein